MLEVTEHLAASGRVTRLRGLLNATTTFILSAMAEGRSYRDALADAQSAGYAEADPSFDVDGRDAAQKLAILAWVAWGRWLPESEVETRGIRDVAVTPGAAVRLVADATPQTLRVGPTELAAADPLAGVTGVEGALEIHSAGFGPLTVRGPGAGGPATAGAVYADLARLVRGERPIVGRPSDRKAGPCLSGRWSASRALGGWWVASSSPSWPMPACRPDRSAPTGPMSARWPTTGPRCRSGSLTRARPPTLDVLFLATDGDISRALVEGPARDVPLVVDNSSAFRLDPAVPLVVPEANAAALDGYTGRLVANPNCTTAAAVVALAPIRDLAGLEAVDVASYQAVSGAGRAGVDAFVAERASDGRQAAPDTPFHGRIADSVVPQIDRLFDDGWSGEERKVSAELRKILDLPDLDVAATTVRVPVHTGHSVALHVRTQRPTTVDAIEAALRARPGRGVPRRGRIGAPSHAARRGGPRPGPRRPAAGDPRPGARVRPVRGQRQPAQGRGAQRHPGGGHLRPGPVRLPAAATAMTRRQWIAVGIGGVAILIAGFAIGFAVVSGRDPSPTITPVAIGVSGVVVRGQH